MSTGRTVGAIRRIPGEGALAAHAVGAAFVWSLAPHGFPVWHARFWTNSVAPLMLLVLSAAALVVLLREKPRWAGVALFALAGWWLGAAVCARVVFPVSLATLWLGGVAAAIVLVAAAIFLPDRKRLIGAVEGLTAAAGALAGALFAVGVQPSDAATAPLGGVAQVAASASASEGAAFVDAETLLVTDGERRITYRPLLTFDRVSPDRFWSLLAPKPLLRARVPGSSAPIRFGDGATLGVTREEGTPSLSVEAVTPVPRETYSHLNSYCVFSLEGCRKPGVAFSASGARQLDVLPAGYPTGAPARFACLLADGTFTVREAASGEKGPFTELASGPLERGEPLKIQFYDAGDWVASLTLEDWSAQASTDLSPTAGWGMPQNAIEFQRLETGGVVNVWVSLAATSVGRGWDTVGHRAGVYRNRSRIEWRGDTDDAGE